ncbi:MaoC/PaaZ C-terminal domain-containing protein [Conexibacter sp. JD483]|uniref:MaoC family dehydratase n=1 Tax=unclassified Conexibacter TaxID=2627773 RepID=UPI002726F644|nr:MULTISPECIES: MaoC/PaaZ C-terminal domain-containing protein [unclassified Conexibacter]MDO8186790.1 MaoC/PaaZ C-terminal domain-containing protein [Conexibacter sp. CPCC 205706]MDO8197456.1 MaoC/PaaZ C-terminal domain-containing protein [Conexibacter sp. CPCC 205762]MDR9370471.1 MaoC/PaaZ C-terminal domain-containing protein [Conexibacter sp. JD483]
MATASKAPRATTRRLSSPPGTLGLYAKAALPLIPGASNLPFVAGAGGRIPRTTLTLDGVRTDRDQLAAYDRVCGFTLRDELPSTFVHVQAFPLHMALMTDGKFPFGAVGLVHLRNRITQLRPLGADERYDLRVHTMPIQPHPKGKTFTIVSEAHVDGELVWQDASTMLRRGKGDTSAPKPSKRQSPPATPTCPAPSELPFVALWKLGGDLGRRYGAVSGDRNPIHMHAYSAKLLGFPKAIAHGMWTKARCLAALESTLPDAYTVDVTFKRPILLPAKVAFAAEDGSFAVRNRKDDTKIHLEGTVTAA